MVDSNATYITRRLREAGVRTIGHRVVPDVESEIVDAMRSALTKADIVITTGGLGPTNDDRTRFAIAKLTDRELKLDKGIVEIIKKRFAKRGMEMPPSNEIQAMLPDGSESVSNPVGMAPGIHYTFPNGKELWALPGVPGEIRAMVTESVVPSISRGRTLPPARTLRTTGLAESALYDLIKPILGRFPTVERAFYPALYGVDIVIMGEGSAEAGAALKGVLNDHIYSETPGERIETVIGTLLREQGRSLATAESCTGGMIASKIVDISGSSDYFLGGIISYSNDVKIKLLGVNENDLARDGAVSAVVAKQMAEGARKAVGADYALSTTGIAGPEGGTAEKPVGLVYIALAAPNGTFCRRYTFAGTRDVNRTRSVYAGLFMLLLALREKIGGFDFQDGSQDA